MTQMRDVCWNTETKQDGVRIKVGTDFGTLTDSIFPQQTIENQLHLPKYPLIDLMILNLAEEINS